VVVLGGDDGGVAQLLQTLEVVDDALAEDGPGLQLAGGDAGGAVVAGELHAVGSLTADADAGTVAGVALA